MTEKLIIENRTEMPMLDVLNYVATVIHSGKISKTGKGEQYCFHTSFADGVHVSAWKNKSSDRLVVWQEA